MSQKQFINYQADILSFEAVEAMLGILNGGRYSGFSTLATNGTPGSGTIPLKIQHTGGIQKLGKGASSLGSSIGVALTTQGMSIHEDQEIPISITDNALGASPKYSIVYMEHEYLGGVPGSNPATYGVVNGASGGGIPTLINSYKRVIIGLIEQAPNNTTISGCTYYPRPSDNILGDSKVLQKLFGPDINYKLSATGVIPSDGVIGNRKYTENNFIIDDESVTDSLDILDISLGLLDDDITEIGQRALDDEGWSDLSDNLINNVSITHHGLIPKLPNDASKFFNGIGGWSQILSKRWKFKNNFSAELTLASFNDFISSSGVIDLSTIVNSDVNNIYLRMGYTTINPNLLNNASIQFRAYGSSSSYISFMTPMGLNYINNIFMVPIDPVTKKMEWTVINPENISTLVFYGEILAQETAL